MAENKRSVNYQEYVKGDSTYYIVKLKEFVLNNVKTPFFSPLMTIVKGDEIGSVNVQSGLDLKVYSDEDYYVYDGRSSSIYRMEELDPLIGKFTVVTPSILVELGFTLEGNRWIHEKGCFIYVNKIPSKLKDLVEILTGTAYKKALTTCKER